MAGDKTYITDDQGKQHRATRVHAVTPTDIVWSSNPNDYSVQVKIGGKWHRAILTMDAGASTFFENVNIDKALVVGSDGKNHTALIVKPESTVTLSDIKTDEHALVSGTTTGETAVVTYEENWSNVKYQDNVNVYKVLVTGSDGKVHTALLTTSSGGGGGVEAIVLGTSPLSLPNAIADSLQYVKAFGGTKQGLPGGYTQMNGITNGANTYVDTGIKPAVDDVEIELRVKPTAGSWYILQSRGSAIWGISGSSTGSTILLGWGGNSSVCQSVITRNATHIYYIKATIKNGLAVLYVKDETVGTEDTQPARYTSSLPPLPFWLYGNQNNDRVNAGNTVYMARIKIGGETVMDYVPAINASNVVGFYDKATGNFVVSSAGTLSTDQQVVPTPDTPMDIVSNNGSLKARHQSGLPWGYTLLEYIEGTGTQWLDTGIVPTLNAKAEVKFMPTQQTSSGYWGARRDPMRFGCVTFSGGSQFSVGMTYNSWPANRTTTSYSTIYDCIVANGYTSINGTEYTETAITLYTTPAPFRLGAFDAGGSVSTVARARFYKCRLWESDTLVFDGVPAQDSNGLVGMYDLVSGQFFTNASVSTPDDNFVAGPVVNDIEVYADGTVETIEDTIGNTATAEMLLKVGDHQDEQEILSGTITRKISITVFDGTEPWEATSGNYYSLRKSYFRSSSAVLPNASLNLLCTHYPVAAQPQQNNKILVGGSYVNWYTSPTYATVDDWKAYLAAQYAAGTPVIVVCPLATETTESVTGQTLQVQGGNNTLEITQASLDGLGLEAKYTKVV